MPFHKFNLIPCVDICSLKNHHHICHICPKAKQTRKPFSTSTIKTASPFELIHIDTWGPYKNQTHTEYRYFLTMVDDFSRCTWTHMMQSKTNVVPIIKSLVSYAENQFNAKVKTIRTDNALELCEGVAKDFYTQKGIVHQTSIRDTPQQNEIVERKHRHLLETARALFFQANLPIQYWDECILTATYLINRFPLTSLKNKTPFEVFHINKPNYNHLRSFGCLCFVSTLKKDRNKFSPRAKPCVFMGYPYGQKGYKVMDLDSGEIFTSRDITFHENIFPFQTHSTAPPEKPNPTHDSPIYDVLDPIYIPTIVSDVSENVPSNITNVQPISHDNDNTTPNRTPHTSSLSLSPTATSSPNITLPDDTNTPSLSISSTNTTSPHTFQPIKTSQSIPPRR